MLTRLLIHLFPSNSGTLNSLAGIHENFRNRYFIENKSFLSKSGDKSKGSQDDRIKNIKMLGETCVKLLKSGTESEIQEIANPEPYEVFNWLVFSPGKAFEKEEEEKCLKILLIHAFVTEVLDKKEELQEYLRAILTGLDSDPTIKYPALSLDERQNELFECLYINPFKFPYSKINQPVSNSSIPVYDRKNDKFIESKTFSDCADIVILHLCNCLFYNDKIDECSLDHLNLKDQPTETNRLRQFYEDYHFRPFEITQEMRNRWSRIVQGLDDNKEFKCQSNYKPYIIHYRKQQYRNEIRSGLFNTMSILASICNTNDAYKEIMTKDTISKDSVVEKLREFLNEISNKNVEVTIEEDGIKMIEYNNVSDFIGNFYITLNLINSKTSVTIKLCILEGHTDFFFEDIKSGTKKINFTELENLKPDSSSFLLSLLINRYIKLLNNDDVKIENFNYPFEILYNQGALHTNEQKRNQCIHLCEYMDKIEEKEHTTIKKMIENIVKSANLSDPATRRIFRPFFIYIDDIFEQMSNYEIIEIWMSLFSNKHRIGSQSIRNTWNIIFKQNPIKIRGLGFSTEYTDSIDDFKVVLTATKDTLEDLKLRNLSINPQNFTQIIQEFLAGNKALKALAIPKNKLSSTNILDILKSLENNEFLKTLDISLNDNFNAEDAKSLAVALKKITSLTSLNISGIFSDNAGIQCIKAILKIKTLTTLDISRNSFGSEDIRALFDALKENTTLTALRISDCGLNALSAAHIAAAIKSKSILTKLDISNNCDLGPSVIKCIADALKNNSTLRILNISQTCCDENKNEFAKYIAQFIQNNAALTSLNISNNGLEAEDAECIAQALRHNTKLTELDISKNSLMDKGAKHIASIFIENKDLEQFNIPSSGPANNTLTTLNISSNNIRNKGAKDLMDAIERSKSLIYLDISNNIFWDKGVNCLAYALSKNKFLKVFNIQSSLISAEDSKKILDALKENKTLEELTLNYPGTENKISECITDALKDNKVLKTLDIKLPYDTSTEDRASLCKIVEKNTALEKVIFRGTWNSYILLSDRVPIRNNTDYQEEKQSSEFQRLDMYLDRYDKDF